MATAALDIIRGEHSSPTPRTAVTVLLTILLGGLLYGAVMGTSQGIGPDNFLQITFSAVKVPILLMVTFSLCLPSYFVLNTLFGLRDDFPQALRALLTTQAGITVLLCALAPYTAFWYINFQHYQLAILFNGMIFGIASISGQIILIRLYRPLIASHPRHRLMLGIWLVQYIAVGIQMGWVLRPFIGNPEIPTEFFRENSWTNAYVAISEMIMRTLAGN